MQVAAFAGGSVGQSLLVKQVNAPPLQAQVLEPAPNVTSCESSPYRQVLAAGRVHAALAAGLAVGQGDSQFQPVSVEQVQLKLSYPQLMLFKVQLAWFAGAVDGQSDFA
ncbi:MAG TPA: hypothetical protein VIV60_20840 [Polyangiaceae bacterium]